MIQTVGLVLAGGLSTRMGGQDKCLLELDGKTLLQRAADRLGVQVGKVALNANSQDTGYMQTGLPVLPDSISGYAGPLAGVLAGLDWAYSEGADHLVTVAADTPFFPDDLFDVMQIALANQNGKIAIAETPSTEGKFFNHPTFGLWPTALRNDLREALENGVRKVMQWVQLHGVAKATFAADPFDPFFNVNRPEDYLKAQALLKEYSL